MPSITTTFIEFLMYIAPGFVVLYSLRTYFPVIDNLIGPGGKTAPSLEAVIPLLLLTIAAGVVVKALSQVLVRILGFVARKFRRRSSDERVVLYRSVLAQETDKLRLFNSYIQNMQTNAAMATALLISLLSMLYHRKVGVQSMSGSWATFVILAIFFAAMMLATLFSLTTLNDLMKAFSESYKEATKGAANGSQPIRSKKDSRSSATGASRRP